MLNLKNTLDGYLKNVEVMGNTIQDTNNLADIRSVGDKVEGQELYKIELACYGDNILRPDFEVGIWNVSNGTAQADSTAIRTKGFLRIRNQSHLVKRFDGKLGCQVILFDGNFKYLGQQSYAGGNYVRYDNILPNAKYMKINFLNTTDLNLQCVLFDRVPSNINGVEFVEFQESELEILSPVQLEKVGDVADKIMCKDGVWGVEKNIITKLFDGSENNVTSVSLEGNKLNYRLCYSRKKVLNNITDSCELMSNKFECFLYSSTTNNITVPSFRFIYTNTELYCVVPVTEFTEHPSVQTFKEKVASYGTYIKYVTTQPQFIPLPHDQQVKLRTFAGQTNIAFLTEIPGQIKAQVPKSLGATVNVHTEQITDLYNSLDRVKKLEETTISTVETESNFTTVDATSNGYFEDVKLEGKTLVNLFTRVQTWNVGGSDLTTWGANIRVEVGKQYTLIVNGLNEVKANGELYIAGIGCGRLKNNSVFTPQTIVENHISNFFIYGKTDTVWTQEDANKIQVMVLEGDHTNNLPAYFEGLMSVGQDVEEVSIESVSENLCPIEEFSGVVVHNSDTTNTVNKIIYKNILLSKNQDYIFNCEDKTNTSVVFYHNDPIPNSYENHSNVYVYLVNGNRGIQVSKGDVGGKGYKYATITTGGAFGKANASINETIMYKNISLKPVASNTIYKPHQSNKKPLLYYNPTTETWEKPILREWDTIEKHSDGKYYYHKRSGEVVLNGSDNQSISLQKDFLNQDATIGFNVGRIALDGNSNAGKDDSYCDKFNCYIQNKLHNNDIEGISQGYYAIYVRINKSKLSTQDVTGFKAWLKANPTTVVYQLAKEEVYECTNIDLMTYSGETNYIINSGAISPKSLLKVHNNISNVVKILQEKVSLLENTFIAGLKSVLSGDMYSLATILYPEDFEQNDNTEQDIMVIPE